MRRLLFAVCALFFGSAGLAQTAPGPNITRAELWAKILAKPAFTDTHILSLYQDGAAGGMHPTANKISVSIEHEGKVYKAVTDAGAVYSAISLGVASDVVHDKHFVCHFSDCEPVLPTTISETVASGQHTKVLRYTDAYGYHEFSAVAVAISGGRWLSRLQAGVGNNSRGFTDMMQGKMGGACNSTHTGVANTNFESAGGALAYALERANSMGVGWSLMAQACVSFYRFASLGAPGAAFRRSIEYAAQQGYDPASYFVVTGLTVTDNPPDADRDGVPDTEDPTPNGTDTDGDGVPDTRDPTPEGPDTDGATKPT